MTKDVTIRPSHMLESIGWIMENAGGLAPLTDALERMLAVIDRTNS
jgi:hypothetical protein